MRKVLPLLIFCFVSPACMQTENSNSQDADTYSDIGGSPGFTAVRSILRQNCANCHSFHTMSEDELVTTGRLKRGDPAASSIYYRLTGSTQGGGPKNMPTGGALTVSDVLQVQTWIDATD